MFGDLNAYSDSISDAGDVIIVGRAVYATSK
jgi:hypothetical protein